MNAARLDALPERESQAVALRYGLLDAETHTLEAIGRRFGLTRERVRHIILRAHRIIISEALSQLKNGLTYQSCARLALFARDFIRPECEGAPQRLAALITQDFGDLHPSTQVISFVASLAYSSTESAKDDIDTALEVLRKRYLRHVRRDLALARFKKLLSYTVWPANLKKLNDEDILDIRQGERVPPATSGSSFYSDKMGRFVKYSSELELKFLRLLECIDEVVEYHEHPFGVAYELDGKKLTYYPDLFILLRNRGGIVVEIIPVFRMALWRNLVSFEILQNYCHKVGLGVLVTDGYFSLEEIRRYHVKKRYASEVMRYLRKKGALDWNTYREIRDRHHANRNDFVGLVVQSRLVWQLQPFRLSLSN